MGARLLNIWVANYKYVKGKARMNPAVRNRNWRYQYEPTYIQTDKPETDIDVYMCTTLNWKDPELPGKMAEFRAGAE